MSTVSTFQYLFQAMTPTGSKTLGFRAATNEHQLADDLRREQLLLLRSWKLPVGGSPPARLPLADEAALNDQLTILLSRGVPLIDALEVAATVVHARSKARIMRLREMVAAGDSFSEACKKLGAFDVVTIAVYRSAERTGDIAGAARRLADSAKRRLSIRGKAITVMIYPAVVFSISILIFVGLLVFLVPMIAAQLRQMKITPNAFSQSIFSLGEWVSTNLGLSMLIVLGMGIGIIILRKRAIQGLLALANRVPAISRLLLTVEMTRFFSVMAAMVKSGIPLSDALATATAVLSSPKLRAQFAVLQKSLVEGGIWRSLVEKVDELPLATRRLLIAAERAGDLDSAFDGLAKDMADEVDVRSARLLAFLEPAAIVLMFLLIGPLILAIAIPLMTFRSG